MGKYAKRREVVDAVQWMGHNKREMFDFLTSGTKTDKTISTEEDTFRIDLLNGGYDLILKTLDGNIKVEINDWVIKDHYEFSVMIPYLFFKKYEYVTNFDMASLKFEPEDLLNAKINPLTGMDIDRDILIPKHKL